MEPSGSIDPAPGRGPEEHWPVVLVPDPPPWPRAFGWLADADDASARCIWYPGEPSDLELGQLRQLTPRIEVTMVRGATADAPGGPVDVLLGEDRIPGVLTPAEHGWAATLLVPADQMDGRGDLAVTVQAAGAPAPVQLRLQVRPVQDLLAGRLRIDARMNALG